MSLFIKGVFKEGGSPIFQPRPRGNTLVPKELHASDQPEGFFTVLDSFPLNSLFPFCFGLPPPAVLFPVIAASSASKSGSSTFPSMAICSGSRSTNRPICNQEVRDELLPYGRHLLQTNTRSDVVVVVVGVVTCLAAAAPWPLGCGARFFLPNMLLLLLLFNQPRHSGDPKAANKSTVKGPRPRGDVLGVVTAAVGSHVSGCHVAPGRTQRQRASQLTDTLAAEQLAVSC